MVVRALVVAIVLGANAGAAEAPPAAAVAPASAGAEEPSAIALLFGKKCSGCHSIGQGDRTGPDLLGVTERRDVAWLTGFIRSPGQYLDRGDPTASGLLQKFNNVRMPDQPLTDSELSALFEYLRECGNRGGCKVQLGKIRPASEATAEDVARGQMLFEGRALLSNGGPPCLSCHSVRGAGPLGGGTLAKDLTFAFARLGDQGISAALASTPFPLMKGIFVPRPLTDAEVFQIKGYLASASTDGSAVRADRNFLYLGALGLALSLGAIGLLWTGRISGVRSAVIKRGGR